MLSLEQALEKLTANVQPLVAEVVPIGCARGRFLAEPLTARVPLPPFDNSAMDGWAVRSEDVAKSAPDCPVKLRAIAKTPAGEFFAGQIRPGECVRVFTGSPIPSGADAVVMQEDTRVENDLTLILEGVKPWENFRFSGEDVKAGTIIAETGSQVTPELAGLISACGLAAVKAHRIPKVALLATGNELREPGSDLKAGEIYESNRVMIASLLRKLGAEPMVMNIVRDDLEATVVALRQASGADAIITCGGVSVGEYDFVKAAIQHLAGNLDFWRVAIKPGKPFLCAQVLGKPLYGLPGNPVSALVTFWLLVRPALLRLSGAREIEPNFSVGELVQDFSNPGDRRHLVRVILDGEGRVRPSGPQASHRLASLAKANGLLDVPAGAVWETGRKVRVIRLD